MTCGKLNGIRIPYRDVKIFSENLIDLREDVPLEFSRKPRSLEDIKHWKPTEFRQILLYTGKLLKKNVLSREKCTHFLSLHVVIRMLCADQCTNINYGELLIFYMYRNFTHIPTVLAQHVP